ncbi:MAG: flagellar two component signal transduction system histidine kinase FlrB [Idiomarinaceae bacterium HL-53]|nr:MAG: flagellar two component signal transduction system histidine kinase FlrB [Idiomarinaceae bacterium HL-53]CUS48397.1 two-component system, sensor histidine kinase FlrB [Idiomarinaceae bacterium HL-53]
MTPAVPAPLQRPVESTQKAKTRPTAAARVKSLIHAMPNGVVLLDSRGFVREVNNEALRLLGEPLLGARWRDVIDRAFRPQADDGHEVSLYSGRRVRLDISSLSPEPGQLIVITDLSETRALLARISHLQRLTAMGKMVASLAHQIRTPLSAAMLYSEGLQRENLPPEQQHKFARKLNERLQDLESQLNDMLLYAKSGEQQPVGHIRALSLMEKLAQQIEAIAQQHEVTTAFQVDVDDAMILGNETALQGALQNIIVNAIHASKAGTKVEVHTFCENDLLKIEVIDTGCGIAKNDLSQIFTPFFTKKQHGTGLGLAVVKTVIHAHQGHIDVESELGVGTKFQITIPLVTSKESSTRGASDES